MPQKAALFYSHDEIFGIDPVEVNPAIVRTIQRVLSDPNVFTPESIYLNSRSLGDESGSVPRPARIRPIERADQPLSSKLKFLPPEAHPRLTWNLSQVQIHKRLLEIGRIDIQCSEPPGKITICCKGAFPFNEHTKSRAEPKIAVKSQPQESEFIVPVPVTSKPKITPRLSSKPQLPPQTPIGGTSFVQGEEFELLISRFAG